MTNEQCLLRCLEEEEEKQITETAHNVSVLRILVALGSGLLLCSIMVWAAACRGPMLAVGAPLWLEGKSMSQPLFRPIANNKLISIAQRYGALEAESSQSLGEESRYQPIPHPRASDRDALPFARHNTTWAEPRTLLTCPACLEKQICAALKRILRQYSVQPATAAPASYRLDTNFYKKYINVMGIPVLSSDQVCDCTLQKAAWIVHGLLSHVKRWREVVPQMIKQRSRVAIMAETEMETQVPEHRFLTPKEYWDARVRGVGATPAVPATSGAEENVMCHPHSSDSYFGENILLHEFAHGIARTGFQFVSWDDKTWDTFNGEVYQDSMRKGLWQNTYAGTNKIEFFAEATQNWFGTNIQAYCCKHQRDCNDGIHNCIDTRQETEAYDPRLYRHLQQVWKQSRWTAGKGTQCGCREDTAALTDGFIELDSHGNVDMDPNPGPAMPPTDDEFEEPVPAEDCSVFKSHWLCRRNQCMWAGKSCRTNCAKLTGPACTGQGTCIVHTGTCQPCIATYDSHHFCEDWASKGECQRNAGYMLKTCKLSCTERDGHQNCKSWASNGQCGKNPEFMMLYCRHSCSCKNLSQ